MKRILLPLSLGLTLLLAACAPKAPPPPTVTPTPASSPTPLPTPTPAGPSYAADIQPIFTERCIKCHSGDNPPRGLRLIDYEHVLAGGTYRPVIVPGKPEESELIHRIRGEAIPRMPFDGPPFLSDEQIALIEAWVAAGAPDN
ncbi:MAG: hypothetical protein Fur0018_18510 [Anaerolineales bacterium]